MINLLSFFDCAGIDDTTMCTVNTILNIFTVVFASIGVVSIGQLAYQQYRGRSVPTRLNILKKTKKELESLQDIQDQELDIYAEMADMITTHLTVHRALTGPALNKYLKKSEKQIDVIVAEELDIA